MIREKRFSVMNDFRTGFFARLFFVFAFVLFLFIIIIAIIGIFFSGETNGILGAIVGLYKTSVIDILLAFLIITVGFGGILLFFNKQFAKLDAIAKEFDEDSDNQNEKKQD